MPNSDGTGQENARRPKVLLRAGPGWVREKSRPGPYKFLRRLTGFLLRKMQNVFIESCWDCLRETKAKPKQGLFKSFGTSCTISPIHSLISCPNHPMIADFSPSLKFLIFFEPAELHPACSGRTKARLGPSRPITNAKRAKFCSPLPRFFVSPAL